MRSRFLGRAAPALAAACTLGLAAPATADAAGAIHPTPSLGGTLVVKRHLPASGGVRPVPASAGHIDARAVASPLPTSQCLTQLGISCYSPAQLIHAYQLDGLYARGVTGKGRTVVIADPLGCPTVQHDLDVASAQWGMPSTTVHLVALAGPIPPYNAGDPNFPGWCGEVNLDVQTIHEFAPDARIVLSETPVPETEGVQGFPEIMTAEEKLIDRGIGDVITQSFGATENTFPGFDQGDYSSLLNLRYAFKDANAHGVTVTAASGDTGSASIAADGASLLPDPAVIWPGSDPLVTSAGGTQLSLDDAGNRLGADAVWNDAWGAAGGGLSSVFSRPAYQNPVRAVVGAQRGMPDISWSSAVNGGRWIYISYPGSTPGWHVFGGTSASAPQFAALIALADQAAGHRLGNVNNALYALYARQGYAARTGLSDVTSGTNTLGGSGVSGYSAAPGYDLASGLGTSDDATQLVLALAHTRR
ncbi:S53 family peptidase [Actinocrinis puniceicyclus]|uniref:S53 family peptidase n=1 Tax=Actinocrinis puniceicyclus TaxID=977794 RepID=A0A8J7WM85_9ACTN|nr:S53 family peptidase [Actinocrinis puniceicyclus]MBS2964951.1 S53 family peptidase [Actinocrinis puniceicyclus]